MESVVANFFSENGIENPLILCKENLDENFLKKRERFAHKGCFGHCLLVSGSYGKAGAGILSSKAALRSGCGLITVHIPKKLYEIFQISVPEAMVEIDDNEQVFSSLDIDTSRYDAIGVGPGLGTQKESLLALEHLLKNNNKPIVIDADGLNLLSKINNFQDLLNENTILTPHQKEFERLFGKMDYKERIDFIQNLSKQKGVIIVLKGGVTAISNSKGDAFFNIKGNPGMATAGSGDVLTGIILGVLAQGYSPIESAKIGVYLHAVSGDIAKENYGEKSLIAGDLITFLHKAICNQ
ncbi:MAG: NAD(P)H-hydrate dehydratase [Bacteroidales bacterium]|nr:NAD(P)H-hydrate dehydratase [Bacteroidales bacterium]